MRDSGFPSDLSLWTERRDSDILLGSGSSPTVLAFAKSPGVVCPRHEVTVEIEGNTKHNFQNVSVLDLCDPTSNEVDQSSVIVEGSTNVAVDVASCDFRPHNFDVSLASNSRAVDGQLKHDCDVHSNFDVSCFCDWAEPKEIYFSWNPSVTTSAVTAQLVQIAGQPIFQGLLQILFLSL